MLEVAVLGKEDRKPLAEVTVNAYRENFRVRRQFRQQTASRCCVCRRAIIRFWRPSIHAAASQTSASVEAGKTNRVEIEIAAPQKITGIVRQPDGQPAAGLR